MCEQHSDLSDDINISDDDIQSVETEVYVPRDFDQINSPSYDDIDNPRDDTQSDETEIHIPRVYQIKDSSLFTSKKSTEQFTDKTFHTHLSLFFSTEAEKYNRIILPVSEIKKRFYKSIKNDDKQYKIDDEQNNPKNFEKYCNFLKEFDFKIKKAIWKRNEHLKLKRLNTLSNNVQQQQQEKARQQRSAAEHKRSMEEVANLRQELEKIFNKKLGR